MKKMGLIIALSLSIFLVACASLDTYEERLEDAGWNVESSSTSDLPDIIDSDEVADETNIEAILFAFSSDEIEIGFIIEFVDREYAQTLYDEITEGDAEDYEGNIAISRNFVFFGTSSSFLEDLNVD